jgi:hypothetical protein
VLEFGYQKTILIVYNGYISFLPFVCHLMQPPFTFAVYAQSSDRDPMLEQRGLERNVRHTLSRFLKEII